MIDVRRLRLLLELSRRGTITAVADALAYTPSAVSQQLAALEREAGVPLLEHAGRRVGLTPAGAVLTGYAESVLAVLEEASAALAATRTRLTGPLRIGAFPTAARTLLPPALVALGRDHPSLELMVTELDPVAVPGALHAGTLDVALTFVYDYVPPEPDPALDTEPLLEETVYLATPATPTTTNRHDPPSIADPPSTPSINDRHDTPSIADPPGTPSIKDCRDAPWIAGTPGTLITTNGHDAPSIAGTPGTPCIKDCRDAPWIAGTPGTLCHTLIVRACQASGFTPRIRHHADDFATVLALVAAGQGVSLIPRLGMTDAPPGVKLTPLPARRRTSIAYRRGTRRHPAVAAFTAAIRTHVASEELLT